MRTSLLYKIFAAFLLTSLTIMFLTVGTLYYFNRRLFVDFVDKMEKQKLSTLAEMLTEEYESSGGWSRLQKIPRVWYNMVRFAVLWGTPEQREISPEPLFKLGDRPGKPTPHDEQPPPHPPGKKDLLEMQTRIFVLDADQQLLAGQRENPNDTELVQISLNGKPIGWVGINRGEVPLAPHEIAFLERQNELFSFIGAGVFVLSAFVSFFLSRHLLAPIKRLTEGTQALSSREFATRIAVRTRDELGQLATDFNEMARTLEQYEEMRKQWISDISHELRTPLSILRGEIEAMQDGVRTVTRQSLDSLCAEVHHLGKIVDDLHELSLADTGALQLERRPVDPIQVLRETLQLFRTRFEQAQITVQEDLQNGNRITLLGDANRLAQIYANILENTLRYADVPGDLRIRQSVSANELTLSFEDSGPGVPEESLDRLFDRLYRVDSARTRSKGGSGLGLAICKTIAESHGGTISAANAPARGLRLELVLPIT